jgi:hypothetical protein
MSDGNNIPKHPSTGQPIDSTKTKASEVIYKNLIYYHPRA